MQKQLNSLLQPRPDKIRLKGDFADRRLRQLRECRNLRKSKRSGKRSFQKPQAPLKSSSYDEILGRDTPERWFTTSPCSTHKWSSINHTLANDAPGIEPSGYISKNTLYYPQGIRRNPGTGLKSFCDVNSDEENYRLAESELIQRAIHIDLTNIQYPDSKLDLDLPEFGPKLVSEKISGSPKVPVNSIEEDPWTSYPQPHPENESSKSEH